MINKFGQSFKDGDIVTVIDSHGLNTSIEGETGVISNIHSWGNSNFFGIEVFIWCAITIKRTSLSLEIPLDHLELAKIKNTRLARKLYPNYKIIDQDWLEIS